jgi:O-antigen ligase
MLNVINSILTFPLAIWAGINHFWWVSASLLPMSLYLFISIGLNLKMSNLLRIFLKPPSLVFIAYFVLFLFFVRWETLVDRDLVEIGALLLYILVFVGGAAAFGHREIPMYIKFFILVVLIIELSQFALKINLSDNINIYGYMAYSSIPFLVIDRLHIGSDNQSSLVKIFVMLLLFLILLFVFNTRMAALGVFTFYVCYKFALVAHRSQAAFNIFYLVFLLFLVVSVYIFIYLYGLGIITDLDDKSEGVFSKGLSGRLVIWPDLLQSISENFWFGKCSNCNSEYFDNFIGTRNLSSHNTYLEILFRNGFLGLGLVLIQFFILARHFFLAAWMPVGCFGFAYLMACLFFMNSCEYIFFATFPANLLFWFFIGIVYGRTNEARSALKRLPNTGLGKVTS